MNDRTSHPVFSLPPLFFSGEGGESGEIEWEGAPLLGLSLPTIAESGGKQWGDSPLGGGFRAFLSVSGLGCRAKFTAAPHSPRKLCITF